MNLGSKKLDSKYSSEIDTLFLLGKGKASESEILGNLIIHYSSDGTVMGLEFLNATMTLRPLLINPPGWIIDKNKPDGVDPGALYLIKSANARMFTVGSFWLLVFYLNFENQPNPVEARFNLPFLAQSDKNVAKALAAY